MSGSRPQRLALSAALAAALGIGLLLLLSAPPERNRFTPSCLFHSATGFHCPGCGATRCLYALLHLDFATAARNNVLALLAFPTLAVVLGRKWWRWLAARPPPLPRPVRFPRWPKIIAAAVIAFFILRNLPWPPFSWLAPLTSP